MSKLTVSIGSKDFDITLDDEFSKFFEKEKSYEEYQDKKEIEVIIDKIENL